MALLQPQRLAGVGVDADLEELDADLVGRGIDLVQRVIIKYSASA